MPGRIERVRALELFQRIGAEAGVEVDPPEAQPCLHLLRVELQR